MRLSIVDCRLSKIGDQSDCVLIFLAGFLFDNSTFDSPSTISWRPLMHLNIIYDRICLLKC
jgi:hypothetical protein